MTIKIHHFELISNNNAYKEVKKYYPNHYMSILNLYI